MYLIFRISSQWLYNHLYYQFLPKDERLKKYITENLKNGYLSIFFKLHWGSDYRKIKNDLRTMTRLDARTQKKFKGEKWIKSIETWQKNEQWMNRMHKLRRNFTIKWGLYNQNLQLQHSLWLKWQWFVVKQNVIYTNLSILKYNFFPSNQP